MNNISKIFKILERISTKISSIFFLRTLSIFFNHMYLQSIQYYLKKHYKFLITKSLDQYHFTNDINCSNYMWVCWFQGYDSAPELVKNCINNLKKQSENHKLIILDENNMLTYAKIPEYIITKYKNGIITKQNFSDILRFALLSQHGGAWIDSTIWLTKPLSEELFDMEVYSIKNNNGNKYNISNRRWTAYFWICKKNSYFAQKVFQFFCEYWKENNFLIDYFLIDHIIAFLYKYDPKIHSILDDIPVNNPGVSDLQKQLLEKYNPEIINNLYKTTSIFKLSWKEDYSMLPENSTYHFLFKGI